MIAKKMRQEILLKKLKYKKKLIMPIQMKIQQLSNIICISKIKYY